MTFSWHYLWSNNGRQNELYHNGRNNFWSNSLRSDIIWICCFWEDVMLLEITKCRKEIFGEYWQWYAYLHKHRIRIKLLIINWTWKLLPEIRGTSHEIFWLCLTRILHSTVNNYKKFTYFGRQTFELKQFWKKLFKFENWMEREEIMENLSIDMEFDGRIK